VDHNAFKKLGSKNRLIKMGSKSEIFEVHVGEIEAKNGRNQAFLELGRSMDPNCVGRIRVEAFGEEISAERLIGGDLLLRISGELSVNFEQKERIEYIRYLLNRGLEEKSRMRWRSAGISTGSGKKEGLSILRD
jgi:hypothetical protein